MKKTMNNTTTQAVTKEDLKRLFDRICASRLAHGRAERTTAMSKDLRDMIYTEEEVKQIIEEDDKKFNELFDEFFTLREKLGFKD